MSDAKKDRFLRWQANPALRGVRISPGNKEGTPAVLYLRATVKSGDQQNAEHVQVHDPETERLIVRHAKPDDVHAIGMAVIELMGGQIRRE